MTGTFSNAKLQTKVNSIEEYLAIQKANSEFSSLDKEAGDNFAPLIAGAISVGLDGTIQGLEYMFGNRNEVDWNSLGVSFGTGVVGVGLVSKVQKLGTIIKFGAETAIDASVSASSQYLKTGTFEGENILVDVIGGKAGGLVGDLAKKNKANSDEMKVVDTFIDRQTRKINNPKQTNPSRIKARENVLNEVENKKIEILNGINVKASVTSSGIISPILNSIVDADDKKEKNAE